MNEVHEVIQLIINKLIALDKDGKKYDGVTILLFGSALIDRIDITAWGQSENYYVNGMCEKEMYLYCI